MIAASAAAAPVIVVIHGAPAVHRRTPHRLVVEERLAAVWRVDHRNLPVDNLVREARTPFVHLVDHRAVHAVRAQVGGGAASADDLKAELGQPPVRSGSTSPLSPVVDRDADRARSPASAARRRASALMNAMPKLPAPPITSPVDFISGPRMGVDAGNRTNGNTSFTNAPTGDQIVGDAESRQAACPPSREPRFAPAARRSPSRDTAPCARRATHFQHVDGVILDHICVFIRPTTFDAQAMRRVSSRIVAT